MSPVTTERVSVAVLGGSFDPPHVGHVLLAAWALSAGGVDRVVVVPTYRHAFGKMSAPFADRVDMARLAFATLDPARVSVSTIEEALPSPSYTVQTLEALMADLPNARLRLLCGADVLGELPRWKDPERIALLAPPLVAGRAGHAAPASTLVGPRGPDLPLVSSTSVRAALGSGESVEGLVPTAVLEQIRKRGLYRGP